MTNSNTLLCKMFAATSIQKEIGIAPEPNLNYLVLDLPMNHPLQKYWGSLEVGDSESRKPQQDDIILLLGDALKGEVV